MNELKRLSVTQTRELVTAVSRIFDIVRIVDPIVMRVIEITPEGNLVTKSENCYSVWRKDSRCENCISYKACTECRRQSKCEFIGNEVYFVTSKPFMLIDNIGMEHYFTIEIVSRISDEITLDAVGHDDFVTKVYEANRRIYLDTVTGVYNRRYFDDKIFCHNSRGDISKNVSFILINVRDFGDAGDVYGPAEGEKLLKAFSEVLCADVRDQDSVIRYSDDTFLVVLNNCTEKTAHERVKLFSDGISRIVYGNKKSAQAYIGCASANKFDESDDSIGSLITAAQEELAANKKSKK
jgi:diguanylate cyclase (GGDEF)-like protein